MRKLLAYIISIYQSKISPYKGFTCAHKGLHKGDSCSEYTKQVILQNGFLSSLKNIRKRFTECREAAETIQRNSLRHQRGDCDLGLSGCDGCDMGNSCGGKNSLALDCMSSCDLLSFERKNRKRDFFILLILLLLILMTTYYFVGRQVTSVDIRLLDGVEETSDRSLSKFFNTQLPDYRIHFIMKNRTKKSNILRNVSAKNWLNLKSKGSLYLSDIQEMIIVDKEITKSIKLESFSSPMKNDRGESFEYRIRQKWDFF